MAHNGITTLERCAIFVKDVEGHSNFLRRLGQSCVHHGNAQLGLEQHDPIDDTLSKAVLGRRHLQQAQRERRAAVDADESHGPMVAGEQLLQQSAHRLAELLAELPGRCLLVEDRLRALICWDERRAVEDEDGARRRYARVRGHEHTLHGRKD